MKKNAKIVLIVLVVVVIAAFVFMQKNKAIVADTVTIEKQDMIREFKERAKLESQNVYALTAPYSDKILFIAEQGKKVKKGDLLLTLDTVELTTKRNELLAKQDALYGQEEMTAPKLHTSQLQSLDIAISMAREAKTNAATDLEKNKLLYQQGAISETQYNFYQRAYQDAEKALALKVSEKQVLLDNANDNAGSSQFYNGQRQSLSEILADIDSKLAQKNLYAEADGVITAVMAEKGDRANPALPLLKVESTTDMLAVCDIISSDAMALKVGQAVEIILKIGQESSEFAGEIVDIAQNASSQISALGLEEQRVEVKVKSPDFKNLIVGSDMDIVFETMHLEDKITVPKTAVYKENGEDHIWLVKGGKLSQQKIEIGKDSDYDYEVLSGLTEGDIVVVDCNNSDLKVGKKIETK